MPQSKCGSLIIDLLFCLLNDPLIMNKCLKENSRLKQILLVLTELRYWQRAYFMPLFKGDGSQLDPDNYRLLAISSVVVKLFEKNLDRRIQVWSERVGLLSDLQGGFRAGRGTVGPPVCLE